MAGAAVVRTMRRLVEPLYAQATDRELLGRYLTERDEAAFENPFRFDVARDPNYHVGFGLGTHFCLGANLARLEIKVIFEEIIARFERFELAGPLAWTNNNRLLGLTHLPVRAVPRA